MANRHFPEFEQKGQVVTHNSLTTLIQGLSELYGPPGSEEKVRQFIQSSVKGFADDIRVDTLGNLIVRKRGSGGGAKAKVMVVAHMDEVGIIVTHVDNEGFCRFAALGDVQPLALLGQRCIFENGVIGVIGREKKKAKPREIETDRLFIDVGSNSADRNGVQIGDAAGLFANVQIAGRRIVGKSLDDRIGCAVLIETLRRLRSPNETYFVFTVQQQVGGRGATTSSFDIQPDLALVVDVTETGDTPQSETNTIALRKGPAIKVKDKGVIISTDERTMLVESAKQTQVPYQMEVVSSGSTDAEAIQMSREGIPTAVLSIPVRYLHTISETADLDDVENATKLLVAVLGKSRKVKLDRA